MYKTNKLDIVNKALSECEKKLLEMPSFQPLLSIKSQLTYLKNILDGTDKDKSKLDEIIIGIYAAREFEDRDINFANLLYEVEEVVDYLKKK